MSVSPKSALLTAISEIQNSTISLPRTGEGQVGSRTYEYLTINKLHSAVFPELQKRGLVWVTYPFDLDGVPALGFELTHIESNEAITGQFALCLSKQDPQGLGSGLTYARRYALLCVLGLVGDDDDGAAGGAESKDTGQQTERPAVPTIPIDRAKKILEAAQEAGLAEDKDLKPALVAKLTEVGVETGRLGHLNVDQAEEIEAFIAKEKT